MDMNPAVVEWYERKTEFWLEKYGPGPRIHYHTGLVDPAEPASDDTKALRKQLFASQEAMLRRACDVWEADRTMRGDLVDVGCGLGGSSIFFAQEFGARVTALT